MAQRRKAWVAAGSPLGALCAELSLHKAHIWRVLIGERRSWKVEAAIAARIGLPVEEVFPPYPHLPRAVPNNGKRKAS